MDLIIPHLYISDWNSSNDFELLTKNKIKAVITLETRSKPTEVLKFYNQNNIKFLYIPIYDMPNSNITKYLDSTYEFISNHIRKDQNVLVHCFAGISRSATIILNYLVQNFLLNKVGNVCEKCVVGKALKFMRRKRDIINPNNGFLKQVIAHSRDIVKRNNQR